MKLYDIIINNTDIKNFCANEKHYYFKLLKQMIDLMGSIDINEYNINLSNKYITNLTITDILSNTREFTFTNSCNGSSRAIHGRLFNGGYNKIVIDKADEKSTFTNAFLEVEPKLFLSIDYCNSLDQSYQTLEIRTLYNDNQTNGRSFTIERYGYFNDYKTYNFRKNNGSKLYTQDVNSLLSSIIEEDKKTIYSSKRKRKALK